MAMGESVCLNVMLVTLQEMRMESYTGISAYCSRKATVNGGYSYTYWRMPSSTVQCSFTALSWMSALHHRSNLH